MELVLIKVVRHNSCMSVVMELQETCIPMDKSLLQMTLPTLIMHYNLVIEITLYSPKELKLALLDMYQLL